MGSCRGKIKKGNMKKIILTGLIAVSVQMAQGALITNITSGVWGSGSTWVGGVVPGAADVGVINSNITSSSVETSVDGFRIGSTANGSLVMSSGSRITTTNGIFVGQVAGRTGTFVIGSGAVYSNAAGVVRITNAKNTTGIMTVDGGKVYTFGLMLGASTVTNNTAKLILTNGASLTQFGSTALTMNTGTNSSSDILIYKDSTLITRNIDFNTTSPGAKQNVSIFDGAKLTLTASDESVAFVFTHPDAKVWYEGGTIIFEGCNSGAGFAAFTNVWNGWVDSGKVDSAKYSDAQLKQKLIFDGVHNYAVVPEPVALGLFIIGGMSVILIRCQLW